MRDSIMASGQVRQYDLIVLGATGYTGKLCAEHVSTSLPTDLEWSIAGRSEAKLLALMDHLRVLNTDRAQAGLSPLSYDLEIY